MNQDYNESGGLLGGKGFYIALMLCVSVIALSAWMIVSGNRDSEAEEISVTVTPALQYEVLGICSSICFIKRKRRIHNLKTNVVIFIKHYTYRFIVCN